MWHTILRLQGTSLHYCVPSMDEGDMSCQERDFVLSVLRYCSSHNKMGCADIRDRLYDLGMKCVVIKDNGSAFKGDDEWTWNIVKGLN